jgi:DNA sulfur modification protein DndB
LMIPALRACMGSWSYYVGFMRMRDIAERVEVGVGVNSLNPAADTRRKESPQRSCDIAQYLQTQEQRFFSTIVVGAYGGNPQWYELDVRSRNADEDEQIERLEGALGFLSLDGTETLFALDGQHRVDGIRKACRQDPRLELDEVSVIFVAGVTQERRQADPEGFERTRRLFTTLNRYAKPVSKKDIIALDEDDIVAIVTRRLIEDLSLFHNRISVKQSKNIPTTDKTSITTIETLYDMLDRFLRFQRKWADFKRVRPNDSVIEEFYGRAVELWNTLLHNYAELEQLQSNRTASVEHLRNSDGGHLLFRPIGLLTIVDVVRRLMDDGDNLDLAVSKVAAVPMDLGGAPWVDLLWDPINRRMITSADYQNAARKVLYFAAGGNLGNMRSSESSLKRELSGLLKRDESSIELRRYVRSSLSA